MCLLVIVIYGVLAFYEFTPLYKQKVKKDLIVNSVFFMFSFFIAMLLCIGIRIPSPANPIREVIISIFGK